MLVWLFLDDITKSLYNIYIYSVKNHHRSTVAEPASSISMSGASSQQGHRVPGGVDEGFTIYR